MSEILSVHSIISALRQRSIFAGYFVVVVLRMGVKGTAIATVISQIISAVLVVWTLCRDDDIYRMYFRKLRIDVRMMKRILAMGIPSGLQSAIISFFQCDRTVQY